MSDMILMMTLATLMMCVLTTINWLIVNKSRFKKASSRSKTAFVGISFGLGAILSTHFGVDYHSMVLNVRDIAPLAAGLLFNPWAGIIAGIIGGVERFIVGQWFDIGTYTRYACSVSTILAGVVAALFSTYLFEKKRPAGFYAWTTAAIMEVFHMLMILLTHIDDINTAFDVVKVCANPMILFTAFGMLIAATIVAMLSGQRKKIIQRLPEEEVTVSRKFQFWLFICVLATLILTYSFTFQIQTIKTVSDTKDLLKINAEDLKYELKANADNLKAANKLLKHNGIAIAYAVSNDVSASGGIANITVARLQQLASQYSTYEIDIVDNSGIIVASNNTAYVGFDMKRGAQSRAFMVLLDGKTKEFTQDFQPMAYDKSISVMYVGVAMEGGFVQIGFDSNKIFEITNLTNISNIASSRHVGEGGNVYIIKDELVVSGPSKSQGKKTSIIGINEEIKDNHYFYVDIEGVKSYCYSIKIGSYQALLTIPYDEMYNGRNIFAYETLFAEILLFAVIFIMIYVLVRRIIVQNLNLVNESLDRITQGNLNEQVNVRASAEFVSLSNDINTTVSSLKHYIQLAENRINAELAFAKEIQHSAIPNVFPPFPDHNEFELYATMDTAKEVGGDFYDFFMIDPTHLALVVADVSGKGIPAALFMMKSKTLIKSLAESGKSPADVFKKANEQLCEGNDAEMFVTAWMGIIDLKTKLMTCVNAGHEYPIIRHQNGNYELFKDTHGFVLAGMEGVKYKEYTIQYQPGDALFVYTDGVTEATDANKELFGTDRLLAALNNKENKTPEKMLESVKTSIDTFVGEESQFDDITMLGFKLNPVFKQIELVFEPDNDTTAKTIDAIEAYLSECQIPFKLINRINIVIDEIVSNIVNYSEAKKVYITCQIIDNDIKLIFKDNGKHYNPLLNKDPLIDKTAEEREIGGLGIYMVKKMVDSINYVYVAGFNIMTLTKKIN